MNEIINVKYFVHFLQLEYIISIVINHLYMLNTWSLWISHFLNEEIKNKTKSHSFDPLKYTEFRLANKIVTDYLQNLTI